MENVLKGRNNRTRENNLEELQEYWWEVIMNIKADEHFQCPSGHGEKRQVQKI